MRHAPAPVLAALLLSFAASGVAAAQPNVEPARAPGSDGTAGSVGDVEVDSLGTPVEPLEDGPLSPPVQPRGEALRQGGSPEDSISRSVDRSPWQPAMPFEIGGVAELPASLDRTSWSLPAGSPAPVEDLELWDEDCYRCVVADGFEGDPRQEPSVSTSLEAALQTRQ